MVGASIDGCPINTTIIQHRQFSNSSMNISINWPESNLGEHVTVDCPCGNLMLGSDSLVAYHFCGGNFRTGGRWENLIGPGKKLQQLNPSLISLSLSLQLKLLTVYPRIYQ